MTFSVTLIVLTSSVNVTRVRSALGLVKGREELTQISFSSLGLQRDDLQSNYEILS